MIRSVAAVTSATVTTGMTEVKQPPTIPEVRSAWLSPVPYLFGGLAAMLGLISFALLILACSYWRLTEAGLNSDHENERDLERGNENHEDGSCCCYSEKVYEEKFLVIMAGNEKPTFVATPVFTYKPSSFENDRSEGGKKVENEG